MIVEVAGEKEESVRVPTWVKDTVKPVGAVLKLGGDRASPVNVKSCHAFCELGRVPITRI